MIDPNSLSHEELREEFARLQADRERTTAGWSERTVSAWATCRDILCLPSKGEQQPVKAIQSVQTVTFGEIDGDRNGPFAGMVSHQHTHLRFANPDDATCACGLENRDLSTQRKPAYPSIIGGQDALLRVRRAGIAEHATAETVLAAAAAAKTTPESPVEALQHRYVAGQIDDQEYAAKLAAIGEPVPAALRATPKPKPAAARAA